MKHGFTTILLGSLAMVVAILVSLILYGFYGRILESSNLERGSISYNPVNYTGPLRVVELEFIKTVSPEDTVVVYLHYYLRNTGNDTVYLDSLSVPEACFNEKIGVYIAPGEEYYNVTVVKFKCSSPGWISGTEHIVVFTYRIDNSQNNYTLALKGVLK